MTDEKLEDMFKKQEELQRLNYPNGIFKNMGYIKDMTLACEQELHEMLRETPWKPWKLNQEWNIDNAKNELIDAQHFIINLALALGMSAYEFHALFNSKNAINRKRLEGGY